MTLESKRTKHLAVFDFDHTVVEANTDIVIRDLLDQDMISDEVKALHKTSGWIAHMQSIFHLLSENNITKDQIRTAIIGIPEVQGIKALIRLLKERNFDVIMISDSNTEFIGLWNYYNKLDKLVDHVFTNPAKFNANGLLMISGYHVQAECRLSSVNLCKGKILDQYISDMASSGHVMYDKIFYIGDGKNDICPIIRLPKGSYGCPRKGFFADREIDKYIFNNKIKLKPQLLRWKDGLDLKEAIFERITEKTL